MAFLEKAGERYGDFVVTKAIAIVELNCFMREIVHLPTGAHVMHLGNDDPENLFCLSFKTLPSSSNGAAHILEHTVLCGSRKFPVKDPFFSMTRRSLNTFMNALTGSDFTCYPAASQVEKDFYNLLDVYLDAVFHPELKMKSFLQEGHRLEFTDPKDPNTPLEYKGIVFNEMKGSLASADTRMWHAMMESLLPDLPYAYNSGGDPADIPKLTYEQLISFHEAFYHPSHCLFFFYGNFPLKQHLDFIQEKVLQKAAKAPPLPPLPLQKRFKEPVYREISYPVTESDDLQERNIITFGWLTAPLLEQEDVLALSVLDSALMDTDASPLKRLLLESNLCIRADAFMDTEMSEIPYVIVCKGCAPENADKLEKTLKDSLKQIIKKGIPPHVIEAAIHQLEFSRFEIAGDHAPFGLTLFMRSALAKQHGCDPENALMVHALFEKLLEKIKDPKYLTDLLQKYLLGNPHFVRLVMRPDHNLSSEELAAEKEKLKKIQSKLSKNEKEQIILQAAELAQYQKETESQSLDCLPKISLDDVSPLARDFTLKHLKHHNLEIFHHDCFTNHIIYADLIFDLPQIADVDLPYVQLLVTLLPELGSGKRDYAANLDFIQAHTGGVSTTTALHVQVSSPTVSNPCLNIRSKALYRKTEKLFELLNDMALSPRLDEKKRIEELVLQLYNAMQSRMNKHAMRYAIQQALCGFSSALYVSESWHGLRYFKTIEEIRKNIEKDLSKLIDKLLFLKDKIFSYHNPHLVVTCDKHKFEELVKNDFYGLAHLPAKPFVPWHNNYSFPPSSSQMRPIASQVAFTVEAYKTISYLHPHAPALGVATHLFDNKILHRKIREQGGAYGSGANYSATFGEFYFHSYRDPHIASTVLSFEKAIEEIAAGNFDEKDLEEAKLGMVQQLDHPISPGSRAITAYSWRREGKTHQIRQNYRDQLLALNTKHVQLAVEKELLPKKDSGVIVSFAGKELLEQENALLANDRKPLPIIPI